jgi:uncharacterized membrane protein
MNELVVVLVAFFFKGASIGLFSLFQSFLIRNRKLNSNFDYFLWALIGIILVVFKEFFFKRIYLYTLNFTESHGWSYLIAMPIIVALDMVFLGLILEFINSKEKKILSAHYSDGAEGKVD